MMPKMTLLEMTQNILSAMDSDDVNSIDDTVESLQVATVIRETFDDIISSRDWPFLRDKFQLEGLADVDNPTKMKLPDSVNKVFWIKYNGNDVCYVDPKTFTDLLDGRTEQTGVIDANGYIINNDPTYWTTFDDVYITFDGFDQDVESTLTSANTNCYGVVIPAWTHEDSFTPAIPDKVFPTLLADAKASCFANIKQQANPREERRAQRGKNVLRNEAWKANDAEGKYNGKVNYGRR